MTPQRSWRAEDDTRRAIASARLLRAIADLRWDLLVLKTALRLHRRYDPNQPRVPAGSAEGGHWTSGGRGSTGRLLAQAYSFGTLVAEIPVPGERRCVYRFDFGSVVGGGGVYVRCLPRIPSAGVVHGYMLNDN